MLRGAGSTWWESNVLRLQLLDFRVFQRCGWIMFLESNGALAGVTYLAGKTLGSCSIQNFRHHWSFGGHNTHNLDFGWPQNSGLPFCKLTLITCTGFFSECLVCCTANITSNKNVTTADHLQVKNFLSIIFLYHLIGIAFHMLGWGLCIALMLPIEWKLWYTEDATFSSSVDVLWFRLCKAPHYLKELF